MNNCTLTILYHNCSINIQRNCKNMRGRVCAKTHKNLSRKIYIIFVVNTNLVLGAKGRLCQFLIRDLLVLIL